MMIFSIIKIYIYIYDIRALRSIIQCIRIYDNKKKHFDWSYIFFRSEWYRIFFPIWDVVARSRPFEKMKYFEYKDLHLLNLLYTHI